ncbi:MAG: helix-turn-helix transcriptional regulator [Saprospiraceae bacterium]|nr:helix-turn-helix transcriptional regulator [Saprospiraceae bacterium]MBK7795503.1 helix-turn-helix transcriptional regulator [Saprospiraceae bacterium]
MKIGDSLKKLRESKGYTQQQMADLIHTHRSCYSKMENNQ